MGDIALAILEIVKTIWYFFIPWTVVDEYERGIVLRLGRPRKKNGEEEGVVGPGFIWHRPFNIDVVLTTNIVFETGEAADLAVQTADGVTMNAHAIAGYTVNNPRKFLLEVENTGDVVLDAVGGAVTQAIRQRMLKQVLDTDFEEEVKKEMSRRFVRFGVRMESFYFHILTPLGMRHGAIKVLTG